MVAYSLPAAILRRGLLPLFLVGLWLLLNDTLELAHLLLAVLLAGLPVVVPGSTLNRLCGSGRDAVGTAARMIRSGDAELVIAGGV